MVVANIRIELADALAEFGSCGRERSKKIQLYNQSANRSSASSALPCGQSKCFALELFCYLFADLLQLGPVASWSAARAASIAW